MLRLITIYAWITLVTNLVNAWGIMAATADLHTFLFAAFELLAAAIAVLFMTFRLDRMADKLRPRPARLAELVTSRLASLVAGPESQDARSLLHEEVVRESPFLGEDDAARDIYSHRVSIYRRCLAAVDRTARSMKKLRVAALAIALLVPGVPMTAHALNLPQVPNLPIPPFLVPDICLAINGCPVQFTDYTLLVKL